MTQQVIVSALMRAHSVLCERPGTGPQNDPPAVAVWGGGTRVTARHPSGLEALSDMPTALGGEGAGVTPGWLFSASLAACATTRIAVDAALAGIELTSLEVRVETRSDLRGLFGLADEAGAPACVGPSDVCYQVAIAAENEGPERLRTLVEAACAASPNARALRPGIAVRVEMQTP